MAKDTSRGDSARSSNTASTLRRYHVLVNAGGSDGKRGVANVHEALLRLRSRGGVNNFDIAPYELGDGKHFVAVYDIGVTQSALEKALQVRNLRGIPIKVIPIPTGARELHDLVTAASRPTRESSMDLESALRAVQQRLEANEDSLSSANIRISNISNYLLTALSFAATVTRDEAPTLDILDGGDLLNLYAPDLLSRARTVLSEERQRGQNDSRRARAYEGIVTLLSPRGFLIKDESGLDQINLASFDRLVSTAASGDERVERERKYSRELQNQLEASRREYGVLRSQFGNLNRQLSDIATTLKSNGIHVLRPNNTLNPEKLAEVVRHLSDYHHLQKLLGADERQLRELIGRAGTVYDFIRKLQRRLGVTEDRVATVSDLEDRLEHQDLLVNLLRIQRDAATQRGLEWYTRYVQASGSSTRHLPYDRVIDERIRGVLRVSPVARTLTSQVNQLERTLSYDERLCRVVTSNAQSELERIMEWYSSTFPDGITEEASISLRGETEYVLDSDLQEQLREYGIDIEPIDKITEQLSVLSGKSELDLRIATGAREYFRSRALIAQTRRIATEEYTAVTKEIDQRIREAQDELRKLVQISSTIADRRGEFARFAVGVNPYPLPTGINGAIYYAEESDNYVITVAFPSNNIINTHPLGKWMATQIAYSLRDRGNNQNVERVGESLLFRIIYNKLTYKPNHIIQSVQGIQREIQHNTSSSDIGRLGITLEIQYIEKPSGGD